MIATIKATEYWTPTEADLPNVERSARFYWETVDEPQRFWVQEAVALVAGTSDHLLEVGCQCGPNLRALAQRWPGMRLDGLDVNEHAIAAGRRFMAAERLYGVRLHHGTLPGALTAWGDGSVDVVLSVYCLAYINPDDIIDTVSALLRIAKKGVIFIEPMVTRDQEPSEFTMEHNGYVEWRHDYIEILNILANELPDGRTLHAAVLPRQKVGHLNGVLIATHQRLS